MALPELVCFPPYYCPPAPDTPRGKRNAAERALFTSSSSENTQSCFGAASGAVATRIPLNSRERIVDEPYILVVPSYGGGGMAGDPLFK